VTDDIFDGKRSAIAKDASQVLAFHELRREPRTLCVLEDLENGHDVGVREPGCGARLAQEALAELGAPYRIVSRALEGDEPAEIDVHGAVNDPHAASTDLPQNFIAADSRSRLDRSPAARIDGLS
jgi:hypothetical protein